MQIKTNNAQTIMSITEFGGLNQDQDGESAIKIGEFSEMRNFRITDGKHLQIRPGCMKVMDVGEVLARYGYSGMPPLDGQQLFVKGGANSYYLDVPNVGRLYANTSGAISVRHYATFYNPDTGQTRVETVTVDVEVRLLAGVFDEGTVSFVGESTGTLGIFPLSAEATQETVKDMLREMASLADDAELTPMTPEENVVSENGYTPAVRGRWHGWLHGKEQTIVAYGVSIYALDFDEKKAKKIGTLDRSSDPVAFFAFDNKLYQTGMGDYLSWDGNTENSFKRVSPYVPIVSAATTPAGQGLQLEAKNTLTKFFRVWFSPDGTSTDYSYPISDELLRVVVKVDGAAVSNYQLISSFPPVATIRFEEAPAAGSNTVEVEYRFMSVGSGPVSRMKFAELFNGATDTRVFLYGDGTNIAYYSGIPYETGRPSAEYFPALNELAVGDASTPITALVRHYSRMLAFKPGSAWVVSYGTIDLADGGSTAAFYVQPVNRQLGNLAPGQVHLLENDPLTLDGGNVYQWKSAGYSAYITSNENNAKRISDRVFKTLKSCDLTTVRTENMRTPHEYWFLLGNGRALIFNYASDAWYYYDNLPFNWAFEDGTETYGLGDDGRIFHFSRAYRNDDGADIDAYAATGAMDFDRDWLLKYSPLLFVALQPESGARVTVTTESDRKSLYPEKIVSAGLATFLHADFAHWAFGTNRRPKTKRVKIKVKKATYYRIIYKSRSATATATILQTDVKLRYAGNVK